MYVELEKLSKVYQELPQFLEENNLPNNIAQVKFSFEEKTTVHMSLKEYDIKNSTCEFEKRVDGVINFYRLETEHFVIHTATLVGVE